ncbi:FAD-binding domain-containing protein [Xylariaceae sp. FL0662B]|nr:FAD-binding domain-containing protein [Xylariaceae sp. FL0662B]
MVARFRTEVVAALAAIPTAQSLAQIPATMSNDITSRLRIQEACAEPSRTCQLIDATLHGENATLFPSDGAYYEDFEDVNYSAACRLPAACIVNPKTTREVSAVMRILSERGTVFAVRSGGHNYIPGFASIDGAGVLVSLSGLNSTQLSDDKKTAKIGPGNRWQAVYEALIPEGLMVPGGRVGPVGVGGYMLGGGISYFSTAHGLAIDNVKSYEVVLGDGSIVTASADNEYSDLYRGLRGGGANFGIVTSFELYTYPIRDLYIDARAYTTSQTSDVLHAVAEYQNRGQLDPLSSVTVQLLETGPTILLLYSEPVQQAKAFDAFYALDGYTPILPATNGSFLDILALSGSRFEDGVRVYGETFSHKADGDIMVEVHNIFLEEVANLPEGATAVWVPNPVAASVARSGKRYGGNILGLEEVPQQWYEWFITWTDPTQDVTVREISARITQRCTDATKAKGLDLPYLFMNTAGQHQDVLSSFGAENVEFIKTVAAKYDPGRMFQKLQHDGFLIRDLR